MEGKEYITGKDMRLVDIILYCALDFGAGVNQTIPSDLTTLIIGSKDAQESAKHLSCHSEKMKMRGI